VGKGGKKRKKKREGDEIGGKGEWRTKKVYSK